jgi:NADH-quinone oxidoreductase subunit J
MAETIAFYTLAALILGFALAVITARNTVHSVLYLVLNFLGVAVLYVVLNAEFLAVIQVLVYAGGIVVLYLFVVMLVNLKRPPEAHQDPRRRGRLGLVMSGLLLAQLVAVVAYSVSQHGWARPAAGAAEAAASLGGNVEQVGWLLYTDYLVPFEVASVLLLVAMIGAIILAKREL